MALNCSHTFCCNLQWFRSSTALECEPDGMARLLLILEGMGESMAKKSLAQKISSLHPRRWYLSANQAEAILFADSRVKPIHFLRRLSNPQGRLNESELTSDRAGRSFSSAPGSKIRHAMVQQNTQHEKLSKDFARTLATFLERGLNEAKYERLVILAGPKFLGLLRAQLPAQVKKHVEKEISLELTPGSDQQIKRVFAQELESRVH